MWITLFWCQCYRRVSFRLSPEKFLWILIIRSYEKNETVNCISCLNEHKKARVQFILMSYEINISFINYIQ